MKYLIFAAILFISFVALAAGASTLSVPAHIYKTSINDAAVGGEWIACSAEVRPDIKSDQVLETVLSVMHKIKNDHPACDHISVFLTADKKLDGVAQAARGEFQNGLLTLKICVPSHSDMKKNKIIPIPLEKLHRELRLCEAFWSHDDIDDDNLVEKLTAREMGTSVSNVKHVLFDLTLRYFVAGYSVEKIPITLVQE